jgi:hypothetical protein
VRFSLKKIACSPVVATNLYGPSGFARDDKGEGSASIDEGDWDGRVRCAASVERDLSIRITKPHESVKSKFVIPSEAEGSAVRPGWLPSFGFSYTLLRPMGLGD